jgi:dinuclear metal center YbgI/SA1388 family protein
MPTPIREIISRLHEHAPLTLAEPWDNAGLLLGDMDRVATSILIGLDPTASLVEEAIALGADTIITHHPLIFKPLAAINTAEPTGRFIELALSHRISVIACHTNLDSAANGVSDALARVIGLNTVHPLVAGSSADDLHQGLGRIGSFPVAVTSEDLLRRLGKALQLPALFIVGRLPKTIATVALCGGSGSDLAAIARERGADIYITAEIKHHTARWAEEYGFCLIEGTHYGTERHAVSLLADILQAENMSQDWNIIIRQTLTEHHPFVLTHIV